MRKGTAAARRRWTKRAKPELDFIAPYPLEVCVRRLEGWAEYNLKQRNKFLRSGVFYHSEIRREAGDLVAVTMYNQRGRLLVATMDAHLSIQLKNSTQVQATASVNNVLFSLQVALSLLWFGLWFYAGLARRELDQFAGFVFGCLGLLFTLLYRAAMTEWRDEMLDTLEFLLLAQTSPEKAKAVES